MHDVTCDTHAGNFSDFQRINAATGSFQRIGRRLRFRAVTHLDRVGASEAHRVCCVCCVVVFWKVAVQVFTWREHCVDDLSQKRAEGNSSDSRLRRAKRTSRARPERFLNASCVSSLGLIV